MGDVFDHPLHLVPSGSRENPGGVLQVHQDQIDPFFLHLVHPAPDQLLVSIEAVAPEDGVGPHLPDHKLGMLGNDVFGQAVDLLSDVLAADPAIEHADLDVWEAVLQLLLKAAWIAHQRRTCADTLRRR
jgi:hypothetical protein